MAASVLQKPQADLEAGRAASSVQEADTQGQVTVPLGVRLCELDRAPAWRPPAPFSERGGLSA